MLIWFKNSFLNYDSGTSTLNTCTCMCDIYLNFIIYKTQFWIEILLYLLLVILSIWELFPTVETSQAGPGNLEVTVNGGRVPTSAQAQGPHTYAISFTPREAIAHTVDLRFNGEDVPGKVWCTCQLCTHSQACKPVSIAPILKLVDLLTVHTLTSLHTCWHCTHSQTCRPVSRAHTHKFAFLLAISSL